MWHSAEESLGIKIGWVDGKLVWDTNLKITILFGFIVQSKIVAFDFEDSVHYVPIGSQHKPPNLYEGIKVVSIEKKQVIICFFWSLGELIKKG